MGSEMCIRDRGITVADLDQPHVAANMGPIAVRGMWYPFVAVGVPQWAEERRIKYCNLPDPAVGFSKIVAHRAGPGR